ncbi:MAG: PAS domain S-box protein [Microscillaceae bacterium]|nr:PAS domain S-box protein [Microscillaceae bacterium]
MSVENVSSQIQPNIENDIEKLSQDAEIYQNGFRARPFHDEALSKFGKIMRWQEGQTLQSWCENLLDQLVPFVGGLQAALYYADIVKKELLFASGFAIDFESNIASSYKFGEGLIGQVALNQEAMVLADKQEFASITSMRRIRLKCIIILPLIYNGRTTGVIELNFPQKPSENYINFLYMISESIASNLNALVKEQELSQSFKKIQASEERLLRLAEVTTEGIVFLNKSRNIADFNTAFRKIFGFESEEMIGKRLEDFISFPDREDFALEQYIENEQAIEVIGVRKDGSALDLEMLIKDNRQENNFFQVVSIRDISQRKKAEKHLEAKEAELEEAQKILVLSKIIEKKNKDITASINYAKRIQNALLPELSELRQSLPESFIFFRPRDIVSGDFFWFGEVDHQLIIACVDCTGHGVPGAILAMAGSVLLKQIVEAQKITAPDEILQHLHVNMNEILRQKATLNRDGMDISICTLDKKEYTLTFAGAKSTLIYMHNQEIYEVHGDKTPVGGFLTKNEGDRKFKSHTLPLDPDQSISFYIFTDGYEDQFGGEKGRKLKRNRFRELLNQIYRESADRQRDILEHFINRWMNGRKQLDDMLIIGFKA